MAAFEYRQAQEIRDAFARHGCRYLFIGKSGAILLGFPDTTQDADLFVEKSPENGPAMVAALRELGFELTDEQAGHICRGKDFIQLKNGPFDLDLIYAPDGIERFADAWRNAISRWMVSPSATSTTSSRAKRPPIARRTGSHCRGWSHSEFTCGNGRSDCSDDARASFMHR